MATKKKTPTDAAIGSRGGRLTDQIAVRIKPAMRAKLTRYASKHELRGVGEAIRHVLDTAEWS